MSVALDVHSPTSTLLSLSSVQMLVTFAATEPQASSKAVTEMRRRVLLSLGAKFHQPERLLNTLDNLHTVLSGKYVLSLLDPLGQVTYNAIDVIAGNCNFSLLVHFLEREEHAKLIDFCPVLRDFEPGSYHYALIFTCPKVAVRVIRSSNDNPITTVPQYAATHFMNYLTSSYLAIGYPSLTFARRGLQLVDNLPGGLVTNFEVGGRYDIVPNGPSCFNILCGSRYRTFTDGESAHMGLTNEELVEVDNGVRWKLGGAPCEEGCTSDVRIVATDD